MRSLLAALAALVVVASAVVFALSSSKDATLSDNGVSPRVFVRDLKAGERVCEVSPAVAAVNRPSYSLAVVAGGYDRSVALQLESVDRRTLAQAGESGAGGKFAFSVPRSVIASLRKLCLRNTGRGLVALAGEKSGPGPSERRVSFVVEDPTPDSWLQKSPKAVRDVGASIGVPLGAGSGLAILALAFAGVVVAIVTVAIVALPGKAD